MVLNRVYLTSVGAVPLDTLPQCGPGSIDPLDSLDVRPISCDFEDVDLFEFDPDLSFGCSTSGGSLSWLLAFSGLWTCRRRR